MNRRKKRSTEPVDAGRLEADGELLRAIRAMKPGERARVAAVRRGYLTAVQLANGPDAGRSRWWRQEAAVRRARLAAMVEGDLPLPELDGEPPKFHSAR